MKRLPKEAISPTKRKQRRTEIPASKTALIKTKESRCGDEILGKGRVMFELTGLRGGCIWCVGEMLKLRGSISRGFVLPSNHAWLWLWHMRFFKS